MHSRFDDVFNLEADPNFLLGAWERVRGNTGARAAGIDGRTASDGLGVMLQRWIGVCWLVIVVLLPSAVER